MHRATLRFYRDEAEKKGIIEFFWDIGHMILWINVDQDKNVQSNTQKQKLDKLLCKIYRAFRVGP